MRLLSSHINVIDSKNFDNRAHVLVGQKSGENQVAYIVANVYAPNANNSAKVDFFEAILDKIYEFEEIYNCSNVIFAGDLNLIFSPNEAMNRNYTAQEKRTAITVGQYLSEARLRDSWEGKTKKSLTWRRANSNTFSCLDRIFFRPEVLKIKDINAVWSLSQSDHAAVVCSYDRAGETK